MFWWFHNYNILLWRSHKCIHYCADKTFASDTFENIIKYRWYDSFLWVTWILPIHIAFLNCGTNIQRIYIFFFNILSVFLMPIIAIWNVWTAKILKHLWFCGYRLWFYSCVLWNLHCFFRIWHSFEFALSMIAEIRQYECIHSLCNVGLSWCFQIQCMYLLYIFNAIVIGL